MRLFEGKISLTHLPDELPKELKATLNNWQKKKSIRITTSGSTSEPKPIHLSDDLVRWSAEGSKLALGLSKDEHVLICLPTDKVGGLMLVLRSVIFNWNLALYEPAANPMKPLVEDHPFSFVSLVPYQMANILDHPESVKKLRRFKTILLGGAALSPALETKIHHFMKDNSVQVFHSYGMTETASHVGLRNMRTMESNTFALLDGVEVSLGETGCMNFIIHSIGLEIQTNDLGRIKDGVIQFLSRADEVLNSGGVKLHLHAVKSKIDNILMENNLSIRYFLWKRLDDALGEKLVFVGLEKDRPIQLDVLLQKELEKFEMPKHIYWVNEFKRTESGKIDRQKTVEWLIEISG
ncbi:MAG: AMP-binding protein [Bacteroidetes bacterium]|jgi:o-succinylbenzoate---CoA ligase|nr:AMP-binding protein [Bacteroidota bacterium]